VENCRRMRCFVMNRWNFHLFLQNFPGIFIFIMISINQLECVFSLHFLNGRKGFAKNTSFAVVESRFGFTRVISNWASARIRWGVGWQRFGGAVNARFRFWWIDGMRYLWKEWLFMLKAVMRSRNFWSSLH
jgi:hypothetical protein